nr:uncharacterized protein LOC128682251 isoform X2 [Plodia interpunctella]
MNENLGNLVKLTSPGNSVDELSSINLTPNFLGLNEVSPISVVPYNLNATPVKVNIFRYFDTSKTAPNVAQSDTTRTPLAPGPLRTGSLIGGSSNGLTSDLAVSGSITGSNQSRTNADAASGDAKIGAASIRPTLTGINTKETKATKNIESLGLDLIASLLGLPPLLEAKFSFV